MARLKCRNCGLFFQLALDRVQTAVCWRCGGINFYKSYSTYEKLVMFKKDDLNDLFFEPTKELLI